MTTSETSAKLHATIAATIKRASQLQDRLPQTPEGEDFSVRVLREQNRLDQAENLRSEGRYLEAWVAGEEAVMFLDILEQEASANGWAVIAGQMEMTNLVTEARAGGALDGLLRAAAYVVGTTVGHFHRAGFPNYNEAAMILGRYGVRVLDGRVVTDQGNPLD